METQPLKRPDRRRARVLPARPLRTTAIMLVFLAVLYAIEFTDQVLTGTPLDANGIAAREPAGLDGVLWAPLLHAGLPHLVANTVPLLVFGWLALANGMRQFLAVTATVWLVSGLGIWLTASPGVTTVGASGLAFGWLVFLLVRGFFNRSAAQILVAVVLFCYWGGILWGVLPGRPGISWQGHLFGALGGLLAAWLVARAHRARGRTGVRAAPPGGAGSPGGSGTIRA